MASYSTMNTIPAADVSETPLLQRDVKINAKTLVGGAALAAFVLGALAATAVNVKAPVRSTTFAKSDRAPDSEALETSYIIGDCTGNGRHANFFDNGASSHAPHTDSYAGWYCAEADGSKATESDYGTVDWDKQSQWPDGQYCGGKGCNYYDPFEWTERCRWKKEGVAWNNDEGKWMCIRDYYGANFKKASSFNPADVAYEATSGIGATLTYKTEDFDMKKLYEEGNSKFYWDTDYGIPKFAFEGSPMAPADTLIYDSARDPKDAKGAYKLWRADGSAGGFFTVELDCKKSSVYKCQLQMTCRDNADWDTLSDDC